MNATTTSCMRTACALMLAAALAACSQQAEDTSGRDAPPDFGAAPPVPAPTTPPPPSARAPDVPFAPRPTAFPSGDEVRALTQRSKPASVVLPRVFERATVTFAEAQAAYARGDYARARDLLDALWREFPQGRADVWDQTASHAVRSMQRNFGEPAPYYALRMLDDATRWRLARSPQSLARTPQPWVMTVVMPMRSSGLMPRDVDELRAGTGLPMTHVLAPKLLEDDYKVLRESLWLFGEYILAWTDGRLALEVNPYPVDSTARLVYALPNGGSTGHVSSASPPFADVPDEVRRATDIWWYIVPSGIPTAPAFQHRTWFIAGGMGGDEAGRAVFASDDRWLTHNWKWSLDQRPAFYGGGTEYTTIERMAYMPQWLHHEMFHHLAGIHAEYALEARSHQWFDRSAWPADFVGYNEPDYYHESMRKRFQLNGPAAFARRLVHRGPRLDTGEVPAIDLATIPGRYMAAGDNPFVRGVIEPNPEGVARGALWRWRNEAGVQFELTPELDPQGRLRSTQLKIGPANQNPYPHLPHFELLLPYDAETGRFGPRVEGFRYGAPFYRSP